MAYTRLFYDHPMEWLTDSGWSSDEDGEDGEAAVRPNGVCGSRVLDGGDPRKARL